MSKTVTQLDDTSRRVLRALDTHPRATVGWMAQKLRLARGTVQSRMGQLFEPGVLRAHSVTVPPETLGYGLRAICVAEVEQELFDDAVAALRELPEVLECVATTGGTDLFMQLVARDADDLYQVNQAVLSCPGIRRTSTTLVLRELIPYRIEQLLSP
ncbi:Lrp/AsnC family transcriptional regulator [Kocuria sp.]|uniref:Lrp/AsnC family transcriptional regulator n=1 Tax=Kocuria sp. TaxID=1871328 RepID=UPI0026E1053B|nr:Lrp/AsnC family transcriptional regulator [Kocuria sp.]MDO5618504.1 Lrp/AsnC family transcriptional regulator [Kocuria sp.]